MHTGGKHSSVDCPGVTINHTIVYRDKTDMPSLYNGALRRLGVGPACMGDAAGTKLESKKRAFVRGHLVLLSSSQD